MSRMLAAAIVLGLAEFASAQPLAAPPLVGQPGYGVPQFGSSGNVMPNFYNPKTQPLSPYLNLLRGGNPGVNYYYGVRPGTVGGAGSFGPAGLAQGGSQMPSFPFQYTPDDPLQLPDPGQGYVLPPAGHPVVFNNTLGYFPGGPLGNRGVTGQSRTAAPRR